MDDVCVVHVYCPEHQGQFYYCFLFLQVKTVKLLPIGLAGRSRSLTSNSTPCISPQNILLANIPASVGKSCSDFHSRERTLMSN